ncbi:hypothetical protein BU14_0205s0017 [Porphyra umbilicalis]|uniref:Dihydrolipoamide acetyltransferase component of pyruvate dehydrogenase complex n=1 Tax=Porphyra umbilicalis TaxID=2786 RepID=A0A1X6P5I7_PORUM|nr:hypothetical protein BU14_0205s0017 [Porphyra umbilicalis]|eukprot:OSX76142.1 hypothetical protein BU14_0205s0017 [Porphyra umbilicalis]
MAVHRLPAATLSVAAGAVGLGSRQAPRQTVVPVALARRRLVSSPSQPVTTGRGSPSLWWVARAGYCSAAGPALAATAGAAASAHPVRLFRAPHRPLFEDRCALSTSASPPADPPTSDGKPFLLADIGEGIATVSVVSWKVADGDVVAAFDPLVEVASDKASVEITAPWGGVVRRRAVADGEVAKVGEPLCWIDGGDGAGGGGGKTSAAAGSSSNGAGDASVESTGTTDAKDGGVAPVANGGATTANAAAGPTRVLAAPAVRRRARDAGVDLSQVDGSGPGGRVLAADVTRVAAARDGVTAPAVTPAATGAAQTSTHPNDGDSVSRVPLTLVRAAMVRSMTEAAAIPHLRLITPVDVTALVGLRRRLNTSLAGTPPPDASASDAAAKLTYLPFFLRATSMALTAHPDLNATFPAPHDAVHVHGRHHISVAVDTPAGLYVPTVRDAGGRSLRGLAAEVARLAAAAGAGRLGVAEGGGGTVALSNIGALGGGRAPPPPPADAGHDGAGAAAGPAGGMVGLPLLLPPQVLIGAVGDVVWEAALTAGGGVTRRAVVQVCWAADHRVVEGGAVARFAATWRALVECPERLLLGE